MTEWEVGVRLRTGMEVPEVMRLVTLFSNVTEIFCLLLIFCLWNKSRGFMLCCFGSGLKDHAGSWYQSHFEGLLL
jgi:hypothetical protein